MADTTDSKSVASDSMWVRLPPPVIGPCCGFSSHGLFLLQRSQGIRFEAGTVAATVSESARFVSFSFSSQKGAGKRRGTMEKSGLKRSYALPLPVLFGAGEKVLVFLFASQETYRCKDLNYAAD